MCYTEPVGAFVMENYMFSQTLTFHNTLISQMAKQPSLPFLTFTSLRDHAYNQLFIHKHPNLITSLILWRPVWTVSTFASKCIQHFIELNVRCVWTGRLNRSSNIVEILIQVVPPFLEESNPVNIIQMSGEAAWKWRVFYWLPRRVFNSLQASILPLGYMHYIQNLMILPRSGWSHSRRKYKGI